jgi:feruloyl esterase
MRSALPIVALSGALFVPSIFAQALASHNMPALGSEACSRLKSLTLPDTTIESAELVAAGPFRSPVPGPGAPSTMQLPAHCRVTAWMKPTSDSNIELAVWLPAADWNGKFLAVGNGGWAGSVSYPAMAQSIFEGYATASTDTGHKGGEVSFAMGHVEKMIDYGWRSEHEMTLKAKAIITAFYGKGPTLSYWNGCSTGGKQGLMEAQRFPEDYDAIIAGAPANYQTHLHAWTVWVGQTNDKDPANFVPPSKYPMIHKAVIAACDAIDGVKDGVLNDPRKCKFDPAKLLCSGADSDSCLTAAQVDTVKKLYSTPKWKTGEVIFPPFEPGSELGWTPMVGGKAPNNVGLGTFQWTYNDPNWDWKAFDLDRDTLAADRAENGMINATNPDLSKFKARGGKLIMYHGWADPLIAPENSINYYNSVQAKMGGKQDDWYRLFMVPGMGHCRGGEGPNQFNAVAVLERWKEQGTAPAQMIASHLTDGSIDTTRPLCPYPQAAVWNGKGSTNDAANFSCKAQ